MATSNLPEEVRKGVKELENEITCPVCQDRFQEPKILPCCHYYCKGCVQALANRVSADKPFACPECRNDTYLPQNDADRLPTAFFVNRMIDLHAKMEKAEGKVEATCEQCSEAKVVAFCRQCTAFICDGCVKVHKKMRVFSSHQVVTLEELKRGGAKQILIPQAPPPMCKVHEEQMKIYCYDCKHLICRDCLLDDHAGHKYEFVKKAVPAIKQKLSDRLAPLKEVHLSLCDAGKAIKSTKREIDEQGASVATKIEWSFEKLHEIIEQRKHELMDKAAGLVKGKIDRLNVQEKGVDMASGTIQSLVEFVEQNIENATEEELMIIHAQILDRIDKETEKHQQSGAYLEPVEEADIVAEVECAEELKKLCDDKAIVFCSPVDLAKSTVSIKSAEVNKPSKVVVQAVSSCGKPPKKAVVVKATLKSSVDESVIQAKIQKKQGGTYEIEYTPTIRGRHHLEVTVNGLPVAGSPLPVFVKISPKQLGKPVKIYPGLEGYGVAFNSNNEMVFAQPDGVVLVNRLSGNSWLRIENSQHKFQGLFGIAVDDRDNIYVTDSINNTVSKFDKRDRKEKKINPAVKRFSARGIAVSGDNIIVADERNHQLLLFTQDLEFVKTIDLHKGCPCGVACDQGGKMYMYVCDFDSECVKVLSAQGEHLYSFSQKGRPSLTLRSPHSICVDSEFIYVSERGSSHCVSIFTKDGNYVTSFGGAGNGDGQLFRPVGLAIDRDGFLYVCDLGNSRVQVF